MVRANASETPGAAESALVWAVNSPQPPVISRCSSRPSTVSVPTPWTARSSSGWWATSRSAPACNASSTTAEVTSTASSTDDTGACRSPPTRPTASQSSAR